MPVRFIEDEELPYATKPRVYNWDEIAASLRENPNKWAVVDRDSGEATKTNVGSAVRNINANKYSSMPADQFVATQRGNQLYMKYTEKGDTRG